MDLVFFSFWSLYNGAVSLTHDELEQFVIESYEGEKLNLSAIVPGISQSSS